MKQITLAIILLFFLTSCKGTNISKIPEGTWNYKLLMNSIDIGTAEISCKKTDGNYVSTAFMIMNSGTVRKTSRLIITETSDFEPLKFENYNKIFSGDDVQEINTSAFFNKGNVEVRAGNIKTKLNINGNFYLAGKYFMSELIKGGFKKGMKVTSNIYYPSIDAENTLKTTVEVKGKKNITINGKEEALIHFIQVIGNDLTFDYYMNENGVIKKQVMVMLNTKIEMVIQ